MDSARSKRDRRHKRLQQHHQPTAISVAHSSNQYDNNYLDISQYTAASKGRLIGIVIIFFLGIVSWQHSDFLWQKLHRSVAGGGGSGGGGANSGSNVNDTSTTSTTASTDIILSTQAEPRNINNNNDNVIIPPNWRAPGELRFDWSNLPVQSQLANEFLSHQTRCDLPLMAFRNRNAAGMGSDLHVYGMALCNAHRRNVRMFTPQPWMYWDRDICDAAIQQEVIPKSMSSMSCYFPSLELQCPNDQQNATELWTEAQRQSSKGNGHYKRIYWETHEDMSCASVLNRPNAYGLFKIMDVRAAITELQFSQVSSVLLQEAKRQHALVFKNSKYGRAPPPHQMITCHVRWGDKGREMALVPIQTYIAAVHKMAERANLHPNETHVFLASEDPRAVEAFKRAAHPQWTIYLDQFYVEMLPHRNNQTQEVAGTAKSGYGHTGLLALGSMIVSMESNYFILSTGSNWSRVMNELRKNVLRPRCHWKGQSSTNRTDIDCTALIDVQPASSQYETGVPARVSQHALIVQKLRTIRKQNHRGWVGPTAIRDAINFGYDVKPESIIAKEEHAKRVKYPRLQKRQRRPGGRRRLHRRLKQKLEQLRSKPMFNGTSPTTAR